MLSANQLDEMNDKFEAIERQQIGDDGCEDAVKQISDIEGSLGLPDLSQFTGPLPPNSKTPGTLVLRQKEKDPSLRS